MSYEAKIIADSISPAGVRLITLQITFPRFILAELSRHRMFSLSVASSRAVPVRKRIEAVLTAPFVPEQFGRNRPGMQARDSLTGQDSNRALALWLGARNQAVEYARALDELGVHKQHVNRLLEPFSWCTAVVTATDFDNFFHLRCHPDAQPEFQKIAGMMRDVMEASTPAEVASGQWHLPYATNDDVLDNPNQTWNQLALVSAARCARVSYLTHDGKRNTEADLALAMKLLAAGHMSPFEHPACADWRIAPVYYGNFRGWEQYRKCVPRESDPLGTHHD